MQTFQTTNSIKYVADQNSAVCVRMWERDCSSSSSLVLKCRSLSGSSKIYWESKDLILILRILLVKKEFCNGIQKINDLAAGDKSKYLTVIQQIYSCYWVNKSILV